MAFPEDPLDPENSGIDRVRILVGDTDPNYLLLSNDLYNYIITSNNNDENKATIQVLEHLVAKYAGYVDEEVGDVEIDLSQLYENFKDLLDRYKNDPRYSLISSPKPYAGGISVDDIRKNRSNPDNNLNPFSQNWVSECFERDLE